MPAFRRAAVLAAACVLLAGPAVPAATRSYSLDLPAGQTLSYRVEMEVPYPGRLVLEAEWSGNRVISFLLVGPRATHGNLRRAGVSPQRMELEIPEEATGPGQVWTLRIRAVPSREHSSGMIRVHFPEPPVTEREPDTASRPIEPPPEPWRVKRRARSGTEPNLRQFFEAIEGFRVRVVGDPMPDSYQWQDDLLRWVAARRDAIADGQAPPDHLTGEMLDRIARSIRQVEELRTSDNPLIIGPPPSDSTRRRAWIVVRRRHIGPVENDLDELMADVHEKRVPELAGENWPLRLVTSLTVCERFFEERDRVGEERANHREVAEQQWQRILAAGEALESLAALSSSPPVP